MGMRTRKYNQRPQIPLLVAFAACLVCSVESQNVDYAYQIREGQSGSFGNFVQDLRLSDQYSADELNSFSYVIINAISFISLDSKSGVLEVTRALDREVECPGEITCSYERDVTIITNDDQRVTTKKLLFQLLDENDNEPKFSELDITRTLSESVPVGFAITDIPTASDQDSPEYGIQGYRLEETSSVFSLEVQELAPQLFTLKLVVMQKLDRETRANYQLKIEAYDPSNSGFMTVNLEVTDSNDMIPVFNASRYDVSIKENTALTTPVVTVTATDKDQGVNGQITYRFNSQTEELFGSTFGIRANSGQIYIKGNINYEERTVYTLVVVAQDGGPDAVPQSVTATITVLDENDNKPEITVNTLTRQNTNSASIRENSINGSFVAQVLVTDEDSGDNGVVTCSLNDNLFALRPSGSDYELVTAGELDREKINSAYSLAIVCQDRGSPVAQSIKQLTVSILDINDHSPVFDETVYVMAAQENGPANEELVTVFASDQDAGINAELTYSVSGNVSDLVSIDPATGTVRIRVPLDREMNPLLSFVVYASDKGDPQLTGSAKVTVTVGDVNDESPNIPDQQILYVLEDSLTPAEIGQVVADDPDLNDEVTFTLMNPTSLFSIDSESGMVAALQSMDREAQSEYMLVVKASDSAVPPHTTTGSVKVIVQDTNDNPPVFVFPSVSNWTVTVSNALSAGSTVAMVQAVDGDSGENARIQYNMDDENNTYFSINSDTGAVVVQDDLTDMNYKEFDLLVVARDSHPSSPLQTRAILRIVVDSSASQPPAAATLKSTPNETAVIAVACCAGVIIVALILGIVLLIMRKHKRRTREASKKFTPSVTMIQPPSKAELDLREQQLPGLGKTIDGRYSYVNGAFIPPEGQYPPQTGDTGEHGSLAEASNADSGRGGSSEEDDTPSYNPYLAPIPHGSIKRKSPHLPHLDGFRRSLLYREQGGQISATSSTSSPEKIYYPDRLNISLPENSIPKANRDPYLHYQSDSGGMVTKSASLKEPYPPRLMVARDNPNRDTPSDFTASSMPDHLMYANEPFQIPPSQVFIIQGRRLKDVYV